MADVFLGKDFEAKTFPYMQAVDFAATSYSGMPWGQAIVDESWESQAIGSGDTGTMNLDIQVPNNYVALLRTFYLGATDPSNINWNSAVLGLAYQKPGGPYKRNITDLPESQYLWWDLIPGGANEIRDRFASLINYKKWAIGVAGPYTTSSYSNYSVDTPTNVPLWLPPGEATLKDRALIVYLENDTAGSSQNFFRLNIVFDLYTIEQAQTVGVMSSPRVFS